MKSLKRLRTQFVLAAALAFGLGEELTGAPIVLGSFVNSPRTNPTCPPPLSGTQPSAADCTVEGGANSLLPNGRLAGLAEGRVANRATNGDYELDIQNNGSVLSTGQLAWTSGANYNFSISYNATTQQVIYNLGGVTMTSNLGHSTARPITDLFLRTTATNSLVGASATLSNLSLLQDGATTSFGTAESSATSRATSGFVSYLWIGGLSNSDFTLNGTATMVFPSFPGNRGSNLAFQIKMGSVNPDSPDYPQSVPEPATVGTIGVALVAVGLLIKRRKTRANGKER
jgi:hypothetical protein